jgi:hypothetical protein
VSAAILDSLRDILEGALSRADAAAVLFAALGRHGPRIPSDVVELAGFVHGPLELELETRITPRALASLMQRIDDLLATADAPTADHAIPIDIEEPARWSEEPSTAPVRAVEGPVPVLVIARSSSLASRLRMALGDHAIDVEARGDAPGIERALGVAPALAVVDARDPGNTSVDALADVLVRARATTTIIWGSDSPYGREVMEAARKRGGELAGVATTEGLGAIFDLVISRRG